MGTTRRISSLIMLCCFMFSVQSIASPSVKVVAITQIVEHPSADDVRKGIKDQLKNEGYVEGKNLKVIYDNAHNNQTTAMAIASKFLSMKPDVAVGIATPSAQALMTVFKNSPIPIVFSAVTDPVKARLVDDWAKPGKNITGTSDMPPIGPQLALIQEILPSTKKIGVMLNPAESNSVSMFDKLQQVATEKKIEIIKVPVLKSSEITAAATQLIGKVDAIYIPLDNTLIQGVEAVVNIAMRHKIPVFAAERDSVKRGALAARGFSHYELGIQTGKQIARILKGEKPGAIPVQGTGTEDIYVNVASAKKLGIVIPDVLVKKAKLVVK